ncbi:hypothetical protein [Arsenicibacter rosenii]|uniref:Uncharacterized protein n=1 Tax=Arsenicibacter rosenii TaxID=1750698 RepID=A0A1S2VBC1_9BACT|nr:hypothetical protein [Arsenicibacter rosenii]OIN55992.1 hypothetical protein BLX24_26955 [Arsenicibacter rosenii]
MASNAVASRLFEETTALFHTKDNQYPSAHAGAALVEDWLNFLKEVDNTGTLSTWLEELRTQLLNNHPDPDRIEEIMFTLAEQTSQLSQGANVQEDTAAKLEQVATALRQVNQES